MIEQNFKRFKHYFELLDQVFEIERKIEQISEQNSINRNLLKIKDLIEFSIFIDPSGQQSGLTYYNPIGEAYNETRLDLEASISGDSVENLVVKEVIKPIIRYKSGSATLIARKGVVIVESSNK